ncbi:hypothetical protein KDA_24440 [Dictyobacter alpinus]|uniref:Uncharacterized protein n=1 Tax=Dictyobacter alpinus TaxID=2014873 RepID=A0A402B6K6_9CHLR|nr:hypothetical protein KDA_24440 [Dictyobacter alpinus]
MSKVLASTLSNFVCGVVRPLRRREGGELPGAQPPSPQSRGSPPLASPLFQQMEDDKDTAPDPPVRGLATPCIPAFPAKGGWHTTS